MNTQDTNDIAQVRQHDQCQQTLACYLTETLGLASKDLLIRAHSVQDELKSLHA
jgi:hypothetical protein